MFTGSINQPTRKLLYNLRSKFINKEIYVGCSGNFTVEGILQGIGRLHSNDVSLYSYAIGRYLVNEPVDYEIRNPELKWIEGYWKDELDKVVTILMSLDYLDYWYRNNRYFKRMAENYRDSWGVIHEQTKAKLQKSLDIRIESYFNGDVVKHFRDAPLDAVLIAFPPTYGGGYEKLYSHLETAYSWRGAEYDLVKPDEMFRTLAEIAQRHSNWLLMSDQVKEEYPLFAKVQSDDKHKPVYLYGTIEDKYFMSSSPQYEYVPFKPIKDGEITDLKLVKLSLPQYRYIRAMYLKKSIVGSDFIILAVAVLNQDNELLGALSFSSLLNGMVQMTLDLSVERLQTRYKKLSKLILMVSQTEEIRTLLQNSTGTLIEYLQTTVFTDRAVSMKYRGVYDLYRKDEGKLIYRSLAGKYKLNEVVGIWKEKYESA